VEQQRDHRAEIGLRSASDQPLSASVRVLANDKELAVSGPEKALACYFSGRTDGLR